MYGHWATPHADDDPRRPRRSRPAGPSGARRAAGARATPIPHSADSDHERQRPGRRGRRRGTSRRRGGRRCPPARPRRRRPPSTERPAAEVLAPSRRRPAAGHRRSGTTAARYATATTASTPPSTEVGFIQLSTGSPASPPAGTRPVAMAPATAPKQNGTNSDPTANAGAEGAAIPGRGTRPCGTRSWPRAARCRTAASVSGTNSVSVIDAYAVGERRPQHDEDEDQPDVVGLPDRRDGVVDHLAGRSAARRHHRRADPRCPAPKSAPPKTA